MRALQVFVLAGLGMVLAAPPVLAQKGGQQTVAVDQLPKPVTAAVEKTYPGSTIVSAAKVSRGPQVRYELSVKTTTDAQPIAVTASADGMIRAGARKAAPPTALPTVRKGARNPAATIAPSQGETVAVNQLPKAVVQAIKEAYPKDVIIDATRFASGSQILYQLDLTDVSSILPMRVIVSSDGKIQKR